MKGVLLIVMLIALLIVSYLVIQDITAQRDEGTTNLKPIERARQAEDKVREAGKSLQKMLEERARE